MTEASITDDIRPLEITLPTIEKKLDDIEADMPKSCSPTPSEEFLALENALKGESSSSDVDMQAIPKCNTINGQDPEQIVKVTQKITYFHFIKLTNNLLLFLDILR